MALYRGAKQRGVRSGDNIGNKKGRSDFKVPDGKSSNYGGDAELAMRRGAVVGRTIATLAVVIGTIRTGVGLQVGLPGLVHGARISVIRSKRRGKCLQRCQCYRQYQ